MTPYTTRIPFGIRSGAQRPELAGSYLNPAMPLHSIKILIKHMGDS